MNQPNPYDSPEESSIRTRSEDSPKTSAIVTRAVEYTIAILLIIALVFAFVQGII